MDLSKDLNLLRCSQNWDLDSFEDIEEHLQKKYGSTLEDYCDGDKYGSNVFLFQFNYHMSYELYRKGRYSEALEYINKPDVTDKFMEKYDRVFKYIVQASKAHILHKMHSIAEAKEIVDTLKNQSFSKEEEAGFYYVQCWLFMAYGREGSKQAVKMIESALEIVPDEAEFNFTLGSVLGKIRHYDFPFPGPDLKEFDACRKAVAFEKGIPHYSVGLARLYMEMRHSVPGPKKKEYYNMSAKLYKDLLKHHASLSGNNIARCIFYLLKLHVDLSELQEYAEIAQKKGDSILINHYIGEFYIANQQLDEALECLSKVSTSLPFICDKVLLLMYRTNNSYRNNEINSFVSKLEENYKAISDEKLRDFYLAVSRFYLYIKDDYDMACKYFLLASKLGIDKENLVSLVKFSVDNYLAILKNELTTYSPKSDVINEALRELKALPMDLTKHIHWNKGTKSLYELRKNLIC